MNHAKLMSLLVFFLLPRIMGGCIPDQNPSGDQVAAPTFLPEEGSFSDSVEVGIECATDGATIRYTLDGATPSSTTSTIYDGSLLLTNTTTVKAVAFKEGMADSEPAVATFIKTTAVASVAITNPSAEGTLTEGQEGTLAVTCAVTASDTTVQSVMADLSQVGGSDAEALSANGDQWTWSGSVTPTSHGSKTITLTAMDAHGTSATAMTAITVTPPPGAPEITNPTVTGALSINKSSSVTVSCTAILAGGTVDFVTADLTSIGGDASQVLTASGNAWAWTGNVTPPASGIQTITFTASSNGNASNSTAMITVTTSQPGALAGAWSGNVTSSDTAHWGAWTFPTETATVASNMTFSPQFQPSTLPVCVGSSNIQIQIPTATLLAVNDQVTSDPQEPRSGTTYHVTAVVTAITRTAKAFDIKLNLTLVNGTSTWHAPYSWTGTLGANDSVTCSGTTNWDLGSGITDNVTFSGTLTRQ